MKTDIIFCIEEPSLLDKVLWNEFFTISDRKFDRLIILSRIQNKNRFIHKILLLQFSDIYYYIKLYLKLRSFNFYKNFRNIEYKRFKNNVQFNLWVKQNLSAQDNLLVSVGCPFIFSDDVINMESFSAINLHNSDTRKVRGQFGTFWEKFLSEKNYAVTLHHISHGVDAGEIIMLNNLQFSVSDKSLLRIIIEKKMLGAKMLQEYLSSEENCVRATQFNGNANNYNFPTINQILKLRTVRYLNVFKRYKHLGKPR